MAKTKRRSRNIARKPKSRPSGFVPQNTSAWSNGFVSQTSKPPSNLAANSSPEAGSPEPEPASGFVSQNAATADTPPNDRAATNRANAQNSTGPRTAEGKARSAQNARKHGLSLQRHAVLEHEDPAAYALLRDELAAIYEPASPREHLALEEIAHCRWALHRFDEAEAALLEYHFAENADPAIEHDCHIPYGRSIGYSCIIEHGEPAQLELPSLLLLHRYRTHWDRRHQRALAEFDRARKDHRQQRRDAERQEAATRKAEREAAAERRREEFHQLRVAEAEAKLAREQANAAREAAKATAQQSKSESNALFDALERYLNTMPNAFDTPGFVPQNRGEHANDAPHSHAN